MIIDVEKLNYLVVIDFLMQQIENILTDGDDFDWNAARAELKSVDIDLDTEYFQP